MQPDLKHIRALAAIKEHGSFRQAAQSLRISSPGLTKIIQALELRLGVELVDRTPNTEDIDIDGDDIWNKDDPDIDGDGITNGIDPDADGDGAPDAEDETPGGPQ